ncbi:molybdenum cofactor biosynthesis protein MoaE [Thermodesulfobacterium sp. TA1]|uniref:molybdenum cofactor biosynthesis protein MoaE n=1 Tax=Thermodesulfobacterium sp. TA1 TaxID=2234087 RepID=UPI0012321D87|nr:molybdenum cofactor biosynthesis protein MoaE [Thermodesulfobacterium sp. TA1]QER41269.1 molybdenum cofactor biosynthesis protein MoaE [Thermodesulfobacterium sp. TA1]
MVFRDYQAYLQKKEELTQKLLGKIGCIVEFNGFVREYDLKEGKVVPAEGLHIKEEVFNHLEDIRKETIERFGLIEAIIYHNQGFLKVGDRVTGFAIFAKHRHEAFEALEHLITEIKKYH